jgi:CRP-like cAMP-binding protein
MRLREPLIEAYKPIDHVYFPEVGVASLIIDVEPDMAIEVATIGPEGFVGTSVMLGVDQTPIRAFPQIAGEALRLPAAVLKSEVSRSGKLCDLTRAYVEALFEQTAQTAACNRIHSIEKRCARWLLMTHDRVEGNKFSLTQEFLAEMLGVRRASVTEAAGALQQQGCIRYSRGVIEIVDRARLELASCSCYAAMRREMQRLTA